MKTIKVAEATELQLDWLVAKCKSNPVARHNTGAIFLIDTPWADKSRVKWLAEYSPTKYWAHGGPIIEQEMIWLGPVKYMAPSVTPLPGREWMAKNLTLAPYAPAYGSTALVAAMRCYITSKLGDTVEVPEELK